jgi:hypothetical protein
VGHRRGGVDARATALLEAWLADPELRAALGHHEWGHWARPGGRLGRPVTATTGSPSPTRRSPAVGPPGSSGAA